MAVAEITLGTPAAYEVEGITIAYKQGDVQDSKFYKGLTPADVAQVAEAIEASGEYTFIGFSVTYRLKTYKEKTLTIASGSADKITWSQVILKRTVDIGGVDVKLQSLYLLMPISSDATKKTAVKTALLNQTIGGAKVVEVVENSVKSL